MRMVNVQGQAVYYNVVDKHDRVRYVVKAISGQAILGRDRERRQSRVFAQEHQAEAWLRRNGYHAG